MLKIVKIGGAYARKADYEYEGKKYEADLKNGDVVKILNEGAVVAGQFGDQQVFSIETRNGEKNVTLNQRSINAIIDSMGDDSKKWVGQKVNVLVTKAMVAGKKCIIAYLVPAGYEIDDFGDLIKTGSDNAPDADYPEEA